MITMLLKILISDSENNRNKQQSDIITDKVSRAYRPYVDGKDQGPQLIKYS